jgi:hypothetical protein
MHWLHRAVRSRERGAALIIVLAFVVLLTGVSIAYLSRATSDRQVAHSSFQQSNVDQLAQSAMDNIIGDLRQEIANGSTAISEDDGSRVYMPTTAANMVPQRSGNAAGAPNLIRRSVRSDAIPAPGVPSRASAVNSTTDVSANGRSVTSTRWNSHYLVPKANPATDDSSPIPAFTAATPDWVFVTNNGAAVIGAPNSSVIGRYANAVYDEGGLLDMNVAGYPTDPSAPPVPIQRVGRKGSVAFADLRNLCPTGDCTAQNYGLPNPNASGVYQIDRLVGWRNCASAQPGGAFPNFTFTAAQATNYVNFVLSNTNGFMTVAPNVWVSGSGGSNAARRTDQHFVQRQELIAFRKTTQFSANALQYLSTLSRETNSPSFSPSTPAGSSIDYAALASTPNAVNPNFLLRRVTSSFTRFDGTTAVAGEPLVKTRFPLSRLAWITYKGPSAAVYAANNNDPAITQLTAAGVPLSTIKAGTSANIKGSFGLVWDSRAYVPVPGSGSAIGQQWVYVSPSSLNTGGNFDPVTNPNGNPASDIKRLDVVASENRESDFFELLRATILDGSLGQDTGGGVTGVTPPDPTRVFPDIHMSNKALHVLSIGASVIDQADPDSIPTRIEFQPTGAAMWWAAYGVESLPYITQIYPISGYSTATTWATYLLFQLWNPHIGPALSPTAPQVRLRVDGNIGIFTGGNLQTWASASDPQTVSIPSGGQSTPLTAGAFAPSGTPAPLGTANAGTPTAPFATLPGSLNSYIGFRLLPDHALVAGTNPQLTLFFGTDASHPFNATMEYLVPGATNVWVEYNRFIGISDPSSWVNGDTLPVRTASNPLGTPNSILDQFSTSRLNDPGPPLCLMKADPRSTRFGIFQMDANLDTTVARILQPLWPRNLPTTIPNGYGGNIADPGGPVEHAPRRFIGSPYYPATLCINNAASTSTRTGYADGDGIIRPADAVYPDPSDTTTGSSTPYYATSIDYHPIILNRPLRNVAELGYAFRDLPWKTLDFFTDKSADAGLLDVFTINDGPALFDGSGNFLSMGPVPPMVAGNVSLNTGQAPVLQSVLAGAILDELNATSTGIISGTGTSATSAPVIAQNIVTETSMPAPTPTPTPCPLANRSELLTRPGLLNYILPVPATGAAHDQRVKSRREAVARAASSVSQTRTWNLLIDVIAQSGRYPSNLTQNPNPADVPKFVVDGEQRYWVHVAIDRFTGQVIYKQIEVVTE